MFEYSDFHCFVFCETSLELLVGLLVGEGEEAAEINVLETCLAFSSFWALKDTMRNKPVCGFYFEREGSSPT